MLLALAVFGLSASLLGKGLAASSISIALLGGLGGGVGGGSSMLFVPNAIARNLPISNGAKSDRRGSLEALQKIASIKASISNAKAVLSPSPNSLTSSQLDQCEKELDAVVSKEEKVFKKAFDEYSQGISYKQEYLDKNAFLVYVIE